MAKQHAKKAGLRGTRGAMKAKPAAKTEAFGDEKEDDDIDLDVYGAEAGEDDQSEGGDHSEEDLDGDDVVDLDDLDTDPLSDDEDAVDGMSVSMDDEEGEDGESVESIVSQMQDLVAKLGTELGVEGEEGELGDDDLDFGDEGETDEFEDGGELDGSDPDEEGGDMGDMPADEDEEDEDPEGPKLRGEETEPNGWVPGNKKRIDQKHTAAEFNAKGKASLPPGKGATGLENRSDNDDALKVSQKANKGTKTAKKLPKSKPANVGNDGKTPKTTPIDKVMTKALESLELDIAEESAGFAELGGFLTESAKAKGRRLFENAVAKRLKRIAEGIDIHYRGVFREEVAVMQSALVEKLDEYMDFVVAQYLEDNAVAVDHGLSVEISESFLAGMRQLFERHNVKVPTSKVDLVEKLNTQLAESEAKNKDIYERAIKVRKENIVLRRREVLRSLGEDLSALQAQKLAKLSEGIEYRNSKQFAEDVKIVKHTHFGRTQRRTPSEPPQFEAIAENLQTQPRSDDRIQAYADIISRTQRKK